jgi:hypothetical protein
VGAARALALVPRCSNVYVIVVDSLFYHPHLHPCEDSQILTVLYEHSIGFRSDPPLPARIGYARLLVGHYCMGRFYMRLSSPVWVVCCCNNISPHAYAPYLSGEILREVRGLSLSLSAGVETDTSMKSLIFDLTYITERIIGKSCGSKLLQHSVPVFQMQINHSLISGVARRGPGGACAPPNNPDRDFFMIFCNTRTSENTWFLSICILNSCRPPSIKSLDPPLSLIIVLVHHYYMGRFYVRTLTLHKIFPYKVTNVNTGITLGGANWIHSLSSQIFRFCMRWAVIIQISN